MIILITSSSDTIESRVNPRFGRTPWFIKYNAENESCEAFENKAVSQRGGAGIAAAQFAVDQGTQVVISGHFGPNAHQALSAGGIKMYAFNSDQATVQQTIDDFQTGALTQVQ